MAVCEGGAFGIGSRDVLGWRCGLLCNVDHEMEMMNGVFIRGSRIENIGEPTEHGGGGGGCSSDEAEMPNSRIETIDDDKSVALVWLQIC
ncbi:hypothetical protein L1987_62721 [Smallanthus sonchifolius]|uniref:Uncharacterized protein n=1 Tax=Smallanthus sonchifolius TaxID=185202 RepID=A0ACB9CBI8_9ASTR|nr:hypothetical protein L1987_62721 [Smallanthus sonchifolius]